MFLAIDGVDERHPARFSSRLVEQHAVYGGVGAKCRQKVLTCRRVINLLGSARHSDEFFYFVVIRRQIFVGDGPVFAESVLQTFWLKIQRSKAPGLSTPHQGSPAHGAQSRPSEF